MKSNCPYYLASRESKKENTVIQVGDVSFGDGSFVYIAGPCAVESQEQIMEIARQVKEAGAGVLRGGAFKPRTSPYDFQGLGASGLRLLAEAARAFNIPSVSEIVDARDLGLYAEIDILQVGARNMQNYSLLKSLGEQKKPVLLKRAMSASYSEWLTSAEYIISSGNPNVILCERGIRMPGPELRNTLDLAAIPYIHRLSHLPIIVDPSHGTGDSGLVAPLSKAAAAAMADGLMIEVHDNPQEALSDGMQSIDCTEFRNLKTQVDKILEVL